MEGVCEEEGGVESGEEGEVEGGSVRRRVGKMVRAVYMEGVCG